MHWYHRQPGGWGGTVPLGTLGVKGTCGQCDMSVSSYIHLFVYNNAIGVVVLTKHLLSRAWVALGKLMAIMALSQSNIDGNPLLIHWNYFFFLHNPFTDHGPETLWQSHSIDVQCNYRKISNIRRTLVGDKIVYHSDVVGASPVGAAPTSSSFLT